MRCPVCDKGALRKGEVKESMFGVALGSFPADICSSCGESFTDSATTRLIEGAAKKKGVWNLGKKTKITKTGNSLAVRIPKELAEYLKLEAGKDVYIHPDKKRLIVES
ncbi:MAG: AbrB/MazE/SpoVT family DNA-binding domain-containing protein [archaeon]